MKTLIYGIIIKNLLVNKILWGFKVEIFFHRPLGKSNDDPLQLSEELWFLFPHLYKIAKRYLTVPRKSVASEIFGRTYDPISLFVLNC